MRELLSQAELRSLARLKLSLRQPRSELVGAHPSLRTGYSLEFTDFRPYQPGDDFRLVDWAAYARLRRLLVRVYKREVESPLYLLLDVSGSMGKGQPKKLDFATRLSAALGFVAYRGQDRFGLVAFTASPEEKLIPRRGRAQLVSLFRALTALESTGTTGLNTALSAWAERGWEPGLCVVISDFLCESGWKEGISALLFGRHSVILVQVLSPQDLDPRLRGELELVDVELGKRRHLAVGEVALRAYREAVAQWNMAINAYASERGIPYFLFSSAASPVEAAWIMLGH
jgi:uncharacterized protein (DUF58 family)